MRLEVTRGDDFFCLNVMIMNGVKEEEGITMGMSYLD